MIAGDRIYVICDLLLGAAYADEKFVDSERERVREILGQLLDCGDQLPADVEGRIGAFDQATFDLAAVAADFGRDEPMSKRRLLELVSLVADADDETALVEDDYIRTLAQHLDMDESDIEGIALDYEVTDMRSTLSQLRPPPVPKN